MPLDKAVQKVHDFNSLVELFTVELDWDIDPALGIDEITFEWEGDELDLSESTTNRLKDGIVRQLQPFAAGQPWGIFFVEFADHKVYRTSLRQVLRSLVPKQRGAAAHRPAWQHENLLFICTTKDYQRFTFAHFRGQKANRAVLATFGWEKGDTHIRTLCEYNLPALRYPADPSNADSWIKQWRAAFDVEAVTDKFFEDYRKVFNNVEAAVRKDIKEDEPRRLFIQRLFNRLMFVYFIQKKGWLSFEGNGNYLRALFAKAEALNEDFLNDRLYWLFFYGMSHTGKEFEKQTQEALEKKRGVVPYLNGGLFDIEDDYDVRHAVSIPNESFAQILELFERYNFTVTESTPLDVQVAVDPEMLGKVFEELVTGRHESGSYYTPRQIVSFMCREALKHYLAEATKTQFEAAAHFVDEEDAGGLRDAEATLEALKRVRVCDPACGSGAYLLGMMQELLRLRNALFKSNRIDAESIYERKRSIIENNLYGADKDRFAVQIACLRLWLSLAIDSQEPKPLPNLDFKIGWGDSLTAPSPISKDQQLDLSRGLLVRDYRKLKGEFMRCDDPERKAKLRNKIDELRAEIALALKHKPKRPSNQKVDLLKKHVEDLKKLLRQAESEKSHAKAAGLQKQLEASKRTLAAWESVKEEAEPSFDWAVEFAEVFSTEVNESARWDGTFSFMNEVASQQMFTDLEVAEGGGFDIVLANPPYIRQELLGREYKENGLKPVYAEVYKGTADLYVYFYARTMQLLREGGVGAFISSNKWLRAGYGEKLRQELLDKQAFHLIVDFGELPVFKAATFPAIFIWRNQTRNDKPTAWAVVKDLSACYEEGVREYIAKIAQNLPASQFGEGKARLASSSAADRHTKMEASGQRLGEVVTNKIYFGIKTGLNEAFIIDRETRDRLIQEDRKSSEIIKPLLVGDDVRRYEINFRENYLIWTYIGISIEYYPSVFAHLKRFQERAEKRCDKGNYWWELRPCDYYKVFDEPKIIYPDIGKVLRFAMDSKNFFSANTTYLIAREDWYLLAVLNSSLSYEYLKATCAALGDEEEGGRLRFFGQYMETLPIPEASTEDRRTISKLAKETQSLHTRRRKRVEQFLLDLGISPEQSTSRNPLERPWALTAEEFKRRASKASIQLFNDVRDETFSLTEDITKIEREIDERVAALYGVPLEHKNR